MLGLRYPFSQYTLQVTRNCSLKCLNCQLWQQPFPGSKPFSFLNPLNPPLDQDLTQFLRHSKNLSYFPKKKCYNIIGGDPLLHQDLLFILNYLKTFKAKTVLWSHGLYDSYFYKKLCPFVDQFILYFPYPDKDSYKEFCGEDGWTLFLDTLSLLKEMNQNTCLNLPLTLDSVEWLADAYDFAFLHNLPLIIHYSKRCSFSKETLRYIHRFRKIKNVYVFKNTRPPQPLCQAFPFKSIENPLQLIQNSLNKFFIKYNIIWK